MATVVKLYENPQHPKCAWIVVVLDVPDILKVRTVTKSEKIVAHTCLPLRKIIACKYYWEPTGFFCVRQNKFPIDWDPYSAWYFFFTCQSRRPKRCGFDPWVGKIRWRRKWRPTPVFLLGESQGQRSLQVCRVAKSRTRLTQLSTHIQRKEWKTLVWIGNRFIGNGFFIYCFSEFFSFLLVGG